VSEDEKAAAALARQALKVSDDLKALVATLAEMGWQPDGHDLPSLVEVANALGGMAIRAGMVSGDAAVMTEVMGRPGKFLTVDDVIADPRNPGQ
jgi:hypothetical protein